MSEETWKLLQKLGGYEAEERGIVHIKVDTRHASSHLASPLPHIQSYSYYFSPQSVKNQGKGNMKTYWLMGEDPLQRQNRIYDSVTHLHHSHFGSSYSLAYDLPQTSTDSTNEHNFHQLLGGKRPF